jgi:major membrane immunogen (membrane-anchored lipoprotein)
MKSKVKIMLCGITLIAACQSKSTKVQSFIDGIYVNHAQSEYAIADDTLTFSHTDVNHYIITRNTGYQAIRDGKLLPKKYKLEKVEGDYDSKTELLNETTTGRVFRFNPDKGILILRQAVYRKIN